MIDKDFEIASEVAAESISRLLTNDGYFARYREHLAECRTRREAWQATENELPFGLRRYESFGAFKNALTLERSGRLSKTVRLQK